MLVFFLLWDPSLGAVCVRITYVGPLFFLNG